jgi:hypothetical protein
MWIDFSHEGGLFPNGFISCSGLAWISFIAWIQRDQKNFEKWPALLARELFDPDAQG